jgi:parallel beta-helix repeat protein
MSRALLCSRARGRASTGRLEFLALLLTAAAVSSVTQSCGDDDDGSDRFAGCDTTIEAGSDTAAIQQIFIDAKSGQTLCFEDGTYALNSELSLTVPDVTVQGNPADREAVVLDYAQQEEGNDALSASGAGFTIQHLTVKNSRGNTIVTKGTERTTFRNLKVYWDAGSSTENGAYAVYPLRSENVLVEDCEVIGAADAGIYVGQSKHIIVRRNKVHGNVAGIEIENSDDALVTENEAFDNSAGILVFDLPNLEKKDGARTVVEKNEIHDNNHDNFGQEGTTVSYIPPGVGVLVLANDETEIRDNNISGNKSVAVLGVSLETFAAICEFSEGQNCGASDAATDPYLSKLYVHGNTFENNGQDPSDIVSLLLGKPVPNVVWDGVKPPDALDQNQLCLGTEPSTVVVFGDNEGIFGLTNPDASKQNSTDAAPYTCTLPTVTPAIDLPQDTE